MEKWSALPLRLGLGIIFIGHGAQKAFGMFGGPGIQGFAKMLASLKFSPATPLAFLVAYIELICGLLLIMGLVTRISASLLLAIMLVAIFKVHLSGGLFLAKGGFEFALILACACISLIFSGPGKFSITPEL